VPQRHSFATLTMLTIILAGVPHLPDFLSHYAKRSDFVAQLNCSELAPYDLRGVLPSSGWLWFWHSFQYPDEHPIVCRYWNGNVKDLKPRIDSELVALPVYFMESFIRNIFEPEVERSLIGPAFFCVDDLDVEYFRPSRDPAMEAALTLLCMRRWRHSVFSQMPKEIVAKIARDVFDSYEILTWGQHDPWAHLRPDDSYSSVPGKERTPLSEILFPLYSMTLDDACGYESCCFFLSTLIPYADAKKGLVHNVAICGGTD
jgi:Domain of unknown function (DUF1963)